MDFTKKVGRNLLHIILEDHSPFPNIYYRYTVHKQLGYLTVYPNLRAYVTSLFISSSVMNPSPLVSATWRPRQAFHPGMYAPRYLKASFNSSLLNLPSPFLSYFSKTFLSCSASKGSSGSLCSQQPMGWNGLKRGMLGEREREKDLK
ncbi:unnamed protein product [Ilex paraguariensis]|uniref:Uncharacterized protein n=1 Tax=Ilex paraguariensis TaxID=185542 RepID=A0ABC8QRG1_9AQUA